MGYQQGSYNRLHLVSITNARVGIKLLGFKDASELQFEDNVKHALFIYPDEQAYAGSKRTFSALIKSLVKKDKIALVRFLPRANSTPTICALVPQVGG